MTASRGALNRISSSIEAIDASVLRERIGALVNELAGAFQPGPNGPKSCEVSFNIKVSGEGSLIISKLVAESNLQVKVVWER
jgi:hypothetical protein